MTDQAHNSEPMYGEPPRQEMRMAMELMVRKVAGQVVRMLPEVDADRVVQQVADEVQKQLITKVVEEVMEWCGGAIVEELAGQIVKSWEDRP